MRHQTKIWILSGGSGQFKEFRIPRWMFRLLTCFILSTIISVSWLGYDYHRLKTNPYPNPKFANTLTLQREEIENQRRQIQSFAKSLQELKQQVAITTALENKVRIIADIQKPGGESGFLGIGGIHMKNLHGEIPLKEDHSILVREMYSQLKVLGSHVKSQKLDLETLISQLEEKRNILASSPTIKPTKGWVTSKFGYRISPFTNKRVFHSGLDIANKAGTEIVATADGKISFTGSRHNYGKMVKIDHGYGVFTHYAHLNKILVKPGQRVKRGQTIALMGNTGRSTGPHLHYEVVVNNVPVNPAKYILN